MSTLVLTESFRDRPVAPVPLRGPWQSFLRRRQERRALAQISRLGPRLIRDIGLDPEAVQATAGGGWDDLRPASLLVLR